MALIGSIAINMKVSTTQLTKGLKQGQTALQAFAEGVGMMGRGLTSMGPALSAAGVGLASMGRIAGTVATGALDTMISVAKSAAASILHLGKQVLFFGTIIGGIAVFSTWSMVKGAVALSEQTDRARIVFGKFAVLVTTEANKMAVAFGVSRREFIQSASAFGTIFLGAKYTEEDAAKLSVHFVKLATDLSSFAHIPVQEAMDKIQSGLAGQVRPLREVGVFMSEAEVETYAYAHGIAKLHAELTESEKIQARIGFITEATAKAQGNLAQTADGAGNTIRALTGRFENLKDEIGLSILQLALPAMQELSVALHAVTMTMESMGIAANATTAGILGGAVAQVQGFGIVQRSIMWLVDAWQAVKIGAVAAMISINENIIKILENMRTLVYVMQTVIDTSTLGMGPNITEPFEKGLTKLNEFKAGLEKLQKQQMAAPQASIAIADAFARARADIEKTREELKNTPQLDVNKLKPNVIAKPDLSVPKFAHAAEADSKDAANAILKSRFGGAAAANEPMKQVAQNGKEAVNLLKIIADRLAGNAQAGGGNALGWGKDVAGALGGWF